jgi:RNA ligase
MKIDLKVFNDLVDQKYIRKVDSPCGKLVLFCYTEKTEYERFWTKETRMARGLIVEKSTGTVIAKPFEKFFNASQLISNDEIKKEIK